MRCASLAWMLALLATPALADVASKAPDSVAVTVYRDRPESAAQLRDDDDTRGLAMIAETRTRISFAGVADTIIPASATLAGLPGGQVERNFDYDLLDPGSLIEKSLGQTVILRRTNPKTGKVEEEPATLRSGPDGVVVETSHGVEALGCGAGPQALVFDHLPPGLADHPTLSVIADVPAAGRYRLTLSYLAVRIDWTADYVARIAPDGKTLDLTGWLTLANRSSVSFSDAPTAVVAGRLARVAPDLPDISPKTVELACWPSGTTTTIVRDSANAAIPPPPPPPPVPVAQMRMSELVVTAQKRAEQTNLGDYKLYTLAEPTTVAARQIKQIRFLHQFRVSFEKVYVFDAGEYAPESGPPTPADVILRLQNKAGDGLGLPIPAGMVSLRQARGDEEYFIGEAGVRDVPSGEEFELAAGQAADLLIRSNVVSDVTLGSGASKRERRTLEFTVTNAGARDAPFELRQPTGEEGFRIAAESKPHGLKSGRDVWRITIPAHAAVTLRYTIEAADS
jgi:hypothetical protein